VGKKITPFTPSPKQSHFILQLREIHRLPLFVIISYSVIYKDGEFGIEIL
jgi:hypothetical protein